MVMWCYYSKPISTVLENLLKKKNRPTNKSHPEMHLEGLEEQGLPQNNFMKTFKVFMYQYNTGTFFHLRYFNLRVCAKN